MTLADPAEAASDLVEATAVLKLISAFPGVKVERVPASIRSMTLALARRGKREQT